MAKKQTIGKLLKLIQVDFNKYIRLRDQGLPCISCGQHKEEYDAGHYFAKSGYNGLRFDEDNVHNECPACNRFDDSHLIGYGENILERIGQERLNCLKERAKDYKAGGHKWSRSDLLELRKEIKQKTLDLES